jgi:nucleotide-binding universal stress UspA family protein
MGLILCATRGGEASYRTQKVAISLAKERNDEIVFLYIINLHFLDKTSAPIVVDIENELEQMGRFFLLMAKEQAKEQGVEVRTIIRKGEVRDEIVNIARDESASLVVLGRPAGKQSAFQMSSLRDFMDEIERVTGAETVLV